MFNSFKNDSKLFSMNIMAKNHAKEKQNTLVKLYIKCLLMVYKLERSGTIWIKMYSLSFYLLPSASAEQIYLCSIVVQFSLVHFLWLWASTQLWEELLSEVLFFLSLENFGGVPSAQNHWSGDSESPTHTTAIKHTMMITQCCSTVNTGIGKISYYY